MARTVLEEYACTDTFGVSLEEDDEQGLFLVDFYVHGHELGARTHEVDTITIGDRANPVALFRGYARGLHEMASALDRWVDEHEDELG